MQLLRVVDHAGRRLACLPRHHHSCGHGAGGATLLAGGHLVGQQPDEQLSRDGEHHCRLHGYHCLRGTVSRHPAAAEPDLHGPAQRQPDPLRRPDDIHRLPQPASGAARHSPDNRQSGGAGDDKAQALAGGRQRDVLSWRHRHLHRHPPGGQRLEPRLHLAFFVAGFDVGGCRSRWAVAVDLRNDWRHGHRHPRGH